MRFVQAIAAIFGCWILCGYVSNRPVPGTRFESTTGEYSCLVPQLYAPEICQSEAPTGNTKALSFTDDMGGLVRIEFWKIEEADRAAFDDAHLDAALDRFFDEQTLAHQFRAVSADARVLYREHVQTPVGRALFAATFIPHGSTLAEAGAPASRDCVRGVLLFAHQNELFSVMNQTWPMGDVPTVTHKEDFEGTLGNLRVVVGGMRFHKDPQTQPAETTTLTMTAAKPRKDVLKSGSVYASPTGFYTLVVPPMDNDKAVLVEQSQEANSRAAFFDSSLHLLIIETKHIPELSTSSPQQISALEEKTYDEAIFDKNCAANSTQAKTVSREYVTTAAGPAFFAAAFIPKGDSLPISRGLEMRADAIRAALIFVRGSELYVICSCQTPFDKTPWPKTIEGRCKLLQDRLTTAVTTMSFPSNVAKAD